MWYISILPNGIVFGTKRQAKQTNKETKELAYVIGLLTLCREHKLTALNSKFCNLNNIQAIVIKIKP